MSTVSTDPFFSPEHLTSFFNWPDDRVVNLTDEEFDKCVRAEMMLDGIEVPPNPSIRNERMPSIPTTDAWEIVRKNGNGYRYCNSTGIGFRSEAEARDALARMIVTSQDQDLEGDLRLHRVEDLLDVRPCRLVERQAYADHHAALQAASAAKSHNDEQLRAWSKQVDDASKLRQSMLQRRHEARTRAAAKARIVDTFNEYVAMAGGNEVLARQFLGKLHSPEAIREAIGDRGIAAPAIVTPSNDPERN